MFTNIGIKPLQLKWLFFWLNTYFYGRSTLKEHSITLKVQNIQLEKSAHVPAVPYHFETPREGSFGRILVFLDGYTA